MDDLPLEKGLTFYYANEGEFVRKQIPVERQVALAYEAGLQAGRHEAAHKQKKIFNPDTGSWA